jgi:hypothetical protein
VIEGKLEGRIEMTGRRGRRRKQLLDDLKEKNRYWKLKPQKPMLFNVRKESKLKNGNGV